jgi:hypothetical protein
LLAGDGKSILANRTFGPYGHVHLGKFPLSELSSGLRGVCLAGGSRAVLLVYCGHIIALTGDLLDEVNR